MLIVGLDIYPIGLLSGVLKSIRVNAGSILANVTEWIATFI